MLSKSIHKKSRSHWNTSCFMSYNLVLGLAFYLQLHIPTMWMPVCMLPLYKKLSLSNNHFSWTEWSIWAKAEKSEKPGLKFRLRRRIGGDAAQEKSKMLTTDDLPCSKATYIVKKNLNNLNTKKIFDMGYSVWYDVRWRPLKAVVPGPTNIFKWN